MHMQCPYCGIWCTILQMISHRGPYGTRWAKQRMLQQTHGELFLTDLTGCSGTGLYMLYGKLGFGQENNGGQSGYFTKKSG